MKKIYLLLFAALVAVNISAQQSEQTTLRYWRGGNKIMEFPISPNDSITFVLSDQPDDPDNPGGGGDTPAGIIFDYDHWRELDTIHIYEFNGHQWQPIALPWASEASTTIPDNYRYPNLESHIDATKHDTFPTWQLAFNTCHNPLLEGVHMFGLWNEKSNVMRIFSYLEELPNPNAAYCFYRAVSSTPAFIDRDAMTWMPSDSLLHEGYWNNSALSGVATVPSTTICDLMPFATLKSDGSEAFTPVFPGWLAFDLPLATGEFDVPVGGSIKLYLEAVQSIDATGTVNFNQALAGSGTGTSTGYENGTCKGGITIPGNDNKESAGYLTAFGSFIHDIGSAITSGVSAGNADDGAEIGIGGAVIQAVGSIFTLVGNCKNADEEGEEKKYGLDFSSKDTTITDYDLHLNFNGTITGQFDAQLTSTLASTAKPVTLTYDKFFEGVLDHLQPSQAAKMLQNNSNGTNLSLGIWNLKHQPVYYVYEKYDTQAAHPNGSTTLLSFFNPSSIELELNMDNPLFDANEIDSITLIAYDYAFVDGAYDLSAQPYYNFYRIPNSLSLSNDPISYNGLSYTDFLLDQSASYKTITKGDKSYTGIASDTLSAHGFGMYNMVYSPAIHIQTNGGNKNMNLSEISVAVIVEMTFKNGEKRLFAERFLPEVRSFSISDYRQGRVHIGNAPESINGIPLKCPMHEMQRQKAHRLIGKIIN